MNIETIAKAIDIEVRDTANDIDAYLASDVPLECYRKDIGIKLTALQARLHTLVLGDLPDNWPLGTTVNVEPDIDDDFYAFTGVVQGYKDEYVQVRDQDNNVFDVRAGQLSHNTDEIMHGDNGL